MLKDDFARECFKGNKNSVISFLLSASYAYYILDRSILLDTTYDSMCKWAYENWDSLEHRHKHLIEKGDLKNGSLFSITMDQYPLIVKNSTERMLNE